MTINRMLLKTMQVTVDDFREHDKTEIAPESQKRCIIKLKIMSQFLKKPGSFSQLCHSPYLSIHINKVFLT